MLSGCGLQPTPSKPKIDVSLPTVTKIRTLSDIQSIALEWSPIYDERIAGYYIYRGSDKKLKRVAKIEDHYSSHYLDNNLKPDTIYQYRMSAFDKSGKESKASDPVRAKTLPIPESVSFFEAIDHLPREVKLIWRPHPFQRVEWYIIERSEPNSDKWQEVTKLKGRLHAEYIDKGLKDNHIYYYRIRVKTCDGILSKYSKTVKANTKPRPHVVKGLTATTNLPKKIIVRWQPNSEPDIDHYNVYKSIFELGPYIVAAKTKRTEYVDLIDEDGAKRYYKVTAVDNDGLESFKQDVPAVGMTLPKPMPPVIDEQRFENGTLFLRWESPDGRAVKYIVKKIERVGFLKENVYTFTNIKSNTFTDAGLKPGAKYIYTIYAIDKYGIESKPSKEIVIKVPKR